MQTKVRNKAYLDPMSVFSEIIADIATQVVTGTRVANLCLPWFQISVQHLSTSAMFVLIHLRASWSTVVYSSYSQ